MPNSVYKIAKVNACMFIKEPVGPALTCSCSIQYQNS